MLFPTATFAIFFLIVLPLSWLAMPKVHRWRPFIIVASYVFYAGGTGASSSCSPAARSGTSCWRSGSTARRPRRGARRCSGSALAGNLGVLGYFKYYDFFVSSSHNLAAIVGLELPLSLRTIVLPVGISFFTFMAISYVVDIYRGDFEPTTLEKFAVYLSFFPHLVAGPIVRPGELIPQLETPRDPRRVDTSRAFYLIATGLFKKVVIANYLASHIVDQVFARAGPALVARDPDRDLRLRRPDLRRLLRLHRHRDRARAPARLHVPAELRLAVRGRLAPGLLAPLAHDALALAARLPLHPARRQPEGHARHLPQPDADDAARRALARRRLDVRRLGRASTAPGSPSSAGGADRPGYVAPRRLAPAAAWRRAARSRSTSSASRGSSSAPTRFATGLGHARRGSSPAGASRRRSSRPASCSRSPSGSARSTCRRGSRTP